MLAEFILSGLPPTINNFYGYGKQHIHKKTYAREWQEETSERMREEWNGQPALKSRLELRIKFTAKDHRKWDIDNRIKPLQDCLQRAGIIEDDRQVDVLIVRREYGRADATHVMITECGNEETSR